MAWTELCKTDGGGGGGGGGSRDFATASEAVPTPDLAQGESNCCTPYPTQTHFQMTLPKAMKAGLVLKRSGPFPQR